MQGLRTGFHLLKYSIVEKIEVHIGIDSPPLNFRLLNYTSELKAQLLTTFTKQGKHQKVILTLLADFIFQRCLCSTLMSPLIQASCVWKGIKHLETRRMKLVYIELMLKYYKTSPSSMLFLLCRSVKNNLVHIIQPSASAFPSASKALTVIVPHLRVGLWFPASLYTLT